MIAAILSSHTGGPLSIQGDIAKDLNLITKPISEVRCKGELVSVVYPPQAADELRTRYNLTTITPGNERGLLPS